MQADLRIIGERSTALTKGATSSTHIMSKVEFLAVASTLFTVYESIQVTYNRTLSSDEQVVVIIGIQD